MSLLQGFCLEEDGCCVGGFGFELWRSWSGICVGGVRFGFRRFFGRGGQGWNGEGAGVDGVVVRNCAAADDHGGAVLAAAEDDGDDIGEDGGIRGDGGDGSAADHYGGKELVAEAGVVGYDCGGEHFDGCEWGCGCGETFE